MQDLGIKYMANKILFIGVGGAGVKAVDKIDFSNAKKIFIDEDCQSLHGLKSEGAKIVEMEQAGCIAVAQFRGFDYGAIIYGGDDVSQDEWDTRSWDKRKGIRYNLVMLCRELVFVL